MQCADITPVNVGDFDVGCALMCNERYYDIQIGFHLKNEMGNV